MENRYRKTKTTISLINYHFIFCPCYRGKVFSNVDGLEEMFKTLVREKCKELDIEVIAIERDYVESQKTRY